MTIIDCRPLPLCFVHGKFMTCREVDIPSGCHGNRAFITVNIRHPRVDILACLDSDAAFGVNRRADFRLPLRPQVVIAVKGHVFFRRHGLRRQVYIITGIQDHRTVISQGL